MPKEPVRAAGVQVPFCAIPLLSSATRSDRGRVPGGILVAIALEDQAADLHGFAGVLPPCVRIGPAIPAEATGYGPANSPAPGAVPGVIRQLL